MNKTKLTKGEKVQITHGDEIFVVKRPGTQRKLNYFICPGKDRGTHIWYVLSAYLLTPIYFVVISLKDPPFSHHQKTPSFSQVSPRPHLFHTSPKTPCVYTRHQKSPSFSHVTKKYCIFFTDVPPKAPSFSHMSPKDPIFFSSVTKALSFSHMSPKIPSFSQVSPRPHLFHTSPKNTIFFTSVTQGLILFIHHQETPILFWYYQLSMLLHDASICVNVQYKMFLYHCQLETAYLHRVIVYFDCTSIVWVDVLLLEPQTNTMNAPAVVSGLLDGLY